MVAISIRNNNPGALMYAPWEKAYGAVPGGKNVAGTLARFPTPAQGYAAAAQWHRRAEARGQLTLNQRMRVYAPPDGAGNSQASFKAYVKRLADSMGITPDTPFSIDDPNLGPKLLLAHAQFESGVQNPFPAGALEAGYKLAPGTVGLANAATGDRTLRKGMEGMDVAALQMRLANQGLYRGPIDGKFGAGTAEAVRATERAANLRIDKGVAGPQVQGVLANSLPQFPAAPSGSPLAGDMSTEAMGFGPRLPPAALFPSGGPVPPMPIPSMPVGGPGTFPAPAPRAYAGNGPGRSPTGPAPFATAPTLRTKDDAVAPFNPFNNPQPWGEVADQSPATLRQRLNQQSPPDVSGGRNIGLMGRAPVNFSNADDAPQYTPGQLRDQKAAEGFGNFAKGVGSFFAPFFGGTQPAQANVPLRSGASAAYGPRPAMPAINRPAPATITPQQFQQRFAPMGAASIPQDVTYRVASLSPVAYSGAAAAPRTISQASFGQRFDPAPTRYDPLSSAYVPKAPVSVPGVTFASPATVPSSKLAPSQYAEPVSERVANATSPSSLGGFYDDQTITGNPQPVVKPPMTPARRVARVAVPIAASAVLGPVGGLLAGGLMRLAQGGPLAQRVGQAISYANAAPRTNGYASSPFTPAGFTAPNYNPSSGGSTYAYSFNPNTGQGSYINSAGRTLSYSVAPSYGGNFGFPGHGTF